MVRALTAAAVILLPALGSGWAAGADISPDRESEITESFNVAVKLLEAASASSSAAEKLERFQEAQIALEKVLNMNPNVTLARKLRDEVKGRIIAQVFLEAPKETIDKLKDFLQLAEEAQQEWLRDKERIAKLIDDLTSGQFDKKWLAVYELRTAGQHAVPQLFEKLKTGSRDDRTAVTTALIASGPPVVLPLGEALKTDDNNLKQEIIFILSQIGDARALPALAAIASGSYSPAIKHDALNAVKRIVGGQPLLSAAVYYLDQAAAYYEKRFEVLQRAYEDYVIWSWDHAGQKLLGRTVPEYAFYLEMAEKLCYGAISLNEHFDDAYALLLCVYYQQYHVCNNLLAAIEKVAENELTEAEIAGIQARKARIVEILRTAPALGKQHVYAALKLALAEGNVAVAVSCSDTLRQLGSAADLPVLPVGSKKKREVEVSAEADPLVAALDSANKGVRYHAAVALAGMAERAFEGAEKVIPILCQALGERGARVALVADSDVQVVNQLSGDLRTDDYIVDTARDVQSTLNVGFSVPMKDVLIVDASFTKAIDTFLADYRLATVPIILLTTDANADQAKLAYEGKAAAFLSKPVEESELRTSLFEVFKSIREETGRTVALSMNYMAAKALANVDPDTTVLPMNDAVAALSRALELPDEVRLEALKALSNIASDAGQHDLVRVAANTGNSLEARLGALEALTSIAIKHEGTTGEVDDLADKLLADKEPSVRSAAARLIGAASYNTSPVKRLIEEPKWVSAGAE